MIVSRLIFLRVRNISDKVCRGDHNTHFVFNFFFFGNRDVYEIMWKKLGTTRHATDYNIIRRARFACWIPKATDTHSEYVIHIAFPRQQWLHVSTCLLQLVVSKIGPVSFFKCRSWRIVMSKCFLIYQRSSLYHV